MLTRVLSCGLLLVLLITGASCSPQGANPVTHDLERAVSIAATALGNRPDTPDTIAVGARQEIVEGKYVWIVTFKLAKLLPADPATDLPALGGELFATVDLKTESVVFTGGD